jgi:hypothetical protein
LSGIGKVAAKQHDYAMILTVPSLISCCYSAVISLFRICKKRTNYQYFQRITGTMRSNLAIFVGRVERSATRRPEHGIDHSAGYASLHRLYVFMIRAAT